MFVIIVFGLLGAEILSYINYMRKQKVRYELIQSLFKDLREEYSAKAEDKVVRVKKFIEDNNLSKALEIHPEVFDSYASATICYDTNCAAHEVSKFLISMKIEKEKDILSSPPSSQRSRNEKQTPTKLVPKGPKKEEEIDQFDQKESSQNTENVIEKPAVRNKANRKKNKNSFVTHQDSGLKTDIKQSAQADTSTPQPTTKKNKKKPTDSQPKKLKLDKVETVTLNLNELQSVPDQKDESKSEVKAEPVVVTVVPPVDPKVDPIAKKVEKKPRKSSDNTQSQNASKLTDKSSKIKNQKQTKNKEKQKKQNEKAMNKVKSQAQLENNLEEIFVEKDAPKIDIESKKGKAIDKKIDQSNTALISTEPILSQADKITSDYKIGANPLFSKQEDKEESTPKE